MPGRLNDFDILKFRGAQAGGNKFGGALDVGDVFGKGADAGDAKEILQLREEPVLIVFDKRVRGEGHTPIIEADLLAGGLFPAAQG